MVRINHLGQKIKIKVLYNHAGNNTPPAWSSLPLTGDVSVEASIIRWLRRLGTKTYITASKKWYMLDADCPIRQDELLSVLLDNFAACCQSPAGNKYRIMLEMVR